MVSPVSERKQSSNNWVIVSSCTRAWLAYDNIKGYKSMIMGKTIMLTTSWPVIYYFYLRPDATDVDQKHKAHICSCLSYIFLCAVQGSPLCTTVANTVRSAVDRKYAPQKVFLFFNSLQKISGVTHSQVLR